jgi:hypothetical protein
LLLDVVTQRPSHKVWPLGQLHCPPLQLCPVAQAVPQAPQFAGSIRVSRHVAPHSVWPLKQEQLPAMHSEPAGQALSQAPQCRSSVFGSTQLCPHSVTPG